MPRPSSCPAPTETSRGRTTLHRRSYLRPYMFSHIVFRENDKTSILGQKLDPLLEHKDVLRTCQSDALCP